MSEAETRERKVTIFSRPPELDIILEDGPPTKVYTHSRSPERATDFDHYPRRLGSELDSNWCDDLSNDQLSLGGYEVRTTGDHLSQLKVCTNKLNLSTRRPSIVAWRSQHLNTLVGIKKEHENGFTKKDDEEGAGVDSVRRDDDLTRMNKDEDSVTDAEQSSVLKTETSLGMKDELDMPQVEAETCERLEKEGDDPSGTDLDTRRRRVDEALATVRKELEAMRVFDQTLAKTLMALRRELHLVKISRYSHAHRELLEEAMDSVERDELDDICDLPPRLFCPDLKQYGVTKMNVQTRRFSVF